MRFSDWSSDVALPICARAQQQGAVVAIELLARHRIGQRTRDRLGDGEGLPGRILELVVPGHARVGMDALAGRIAELPAGRSEERRVGKEGVSTCQSRGSPEQ